MKVKVSNSLDNLPNENVVTTGDRQTNQPTNRQTDQLLELLQWLFATKNVLSSSLRRCILKCRIYSGQGDIRKFPLDVVVIAEGSSCA